MDDVLREILNELRELRQGQNELRQGQQAQAQELKELRQGQHKLRQGQEKIAKDLSKLAAHVEGEITDKIRGLYDARGLMLESLARIEERQNRQDERLDRHWQEILVLKNKRR
ncbi:hypothetical protein [Candidatus Desulforudis audaxviator]|uniref:Uncharacterized protein n=1 Tax=Desulforudis audaxviator (strain MP104C) TaxID=477974 RepID=B1I3C7_DESAP|nr:hypothetical protein [Candidatus Desulforudis audaxviator]ACA59492.1 hypothetical protein Daud_0980 [Candidatus Desulforudis audaxviator MP104C]AZK59475.1 hypothetical protein Daudx_0923 [Candidatus Desulforudis audaxviator]